MPKDTRVCFDITPPPLVMYDEDPKMPLQHPRVEMMEMMAVSKGEDKLSQMIVASLQKPVVASLQKPIVMSLKPPLQTQIMPQDIEQSIAAHVKVQCNPTKFENTDSIAVRLLARQRGSKAATPNKQAFTVVNMGMGELLKYWQLHHTKFKKDWNISANEFGHLAQGVGGRVQGTNTIYFIAKGEVPQDGFKDITYIRFVCTVWTKKNEPNWTRAIMGGNLIDYPDDVGTPTANLLLIKIFLNSVIST